MMNCFCCIYWRQVTADKLYWFDIVDMLADGLTKRAVVREALLDVCELGI